MRTGCARRTIDAVQRCAESQWSQHSGYLSDLGARIPQMQFSDVTDSLTVRTTVPVDAAITSARASGRTAGGDVDARQRLTAIWVRADTTRSTAWMMDRHRVLPDSRYAYATKLSDRPTHVCLGPSHTVVQARLPLHSLSTQSSSSSFKRSIIPSLCLLAPSPDNHSFKALSSSCYLLERKMRGAPIAINIT